MVITTQGCSLPHWNAEHNQVKEGDKTTHSSPLFDEPFGSCVANGVTDSQSIASYACQTIANTSMTTEIRVDRQQTDNGSPPASSSLRDLRKEWNADRAPGNSGATIVVKPQLGGRPMLWSFSKEVRALSRRCYRSSKRLPE